MRLFCSVRGISVDFIRGVIVGPFGTAVTLMMQRPSNEVYTVTLSRTYGEQAQEDNSMDPLDGSILWNDAMGALHKEANALQLQVQGLERTVGSLQGHLVRSQSESEKRGEVIDKQNKKLAIAESFHAQLDVEKCKIEVMSPFLHHAGSCSLAVRLKHISDLYGYLKKMALIKSSLFCSNMPLTCSAAICP
jgi:hypothetical protein